ncbi:MAG: xylosidase [Muribaculaceae bacterium]|nr:xylosidase [Muribaculaceae bacterium]
MNKSFCMLMCGLLLAGCTSKRIAVSTFDSYRGLVMAGYQGWFNAEGDSENRGFYHYTGRNGFRPGSATVDMWPDVSEYEKSYTTEFRMADGSAARVFSSSDASTVDTHFRWMKEYGLDGVFMQRFVGEIKGQSGRSHFNKVLSSAMDAAKKYGRAICVMYDLSGMRPEDSEILLADIKEVADGYGLFDRKTNPSYLYHNGKPLVAVWGVGFDDGRAYGLDDCAAIISGLKDQGYSVMIGVPTHWRELNGDTTSDPALHDIIRQCDIVMPWFVARYTPDTFGNFKGLIADDAKWCADEGLDYAPLVFPGFSWKNMYGKETHAIPRNRGGFLQSQIDYSLDAGAKMLYVAMFDEIDEGTAIFKCATEVPVDSLGTSFVPIEDGLGSDHYLKIVGNAAKTLKKRIRSN